MIITVQLHNSWLTRSISKSDLRSRFKFHAIFSHSKKTFMRNMTCSRFSNLQMPTFVLFRHILSNKDFITGLVVLTTTKTGRKYLLTHSFTMHSFSALWKHQKTVRSSDVFWGWRKGALGTNGLIAYRIILMQLKKIRTDKN